MPGVLSLETKQYEIRLDNFEGPLDLLCHLIDKNKMDIYKVKISDIADQYIEYINNMEKLNLEVTSEFLIMASTLLYIKSKALLPKTVEDEAELTEEELLHRIIEYKRYKEISGVLKEKYTLYSNRFYKLPDNVELPKQDLNQIYDKSLISQYYKELQNKMEEKVNLNSKENMEKIAIAETVTITSKVKIIFKELIRRPKFVFNKLFSKEENTNLDIVTAFLGVLELDRRNKVKVEQEKLFGDIVVEKVKGIENIEKDEAIEEV